MISKKKIGKLVIKILWWLGITVIGIIGGTITTYHMVYSQKIYPKIFVGVVELSNLSIQEAENRLIKLIPKKPGIIELIFDDQSWSIDLKKLGLIYRPTATIQRAYILGRSEGLIKNLKTKWELWQKGKNLKIDFQINEEELEEKINLAISQVDEPPIVPTLELTKAGEIEIVPGKNGRLVEKENLRTILLANVGNLKFEKIEMPIKIVEVGISSEQLGKTQVRAGGLKDKKIKLKYEGFVKNLAGQELLDLMDFDGGWNEKKIASFSMTLAKSINRPTQNAVFQFSGGRVIEFKPALQGLKLDEAKATKSIKETLIRLEEDASPMGEILDEEAIKEPVVELTAEISEPKIKTEAVNDLGIKELLGKGESTFHGSIASREHNIALTAGKLNGILIAPGKTFSFNKALGDVSAATGFQQAYIIKEGRTVLGDGGGVCQASTTMFRAALNSGLLIIERHPHAYRVSYYEQNSPPGIDATVYEPSPDLKFKNDTPAHILIQTKVNTGSNYLAIEIYGTSDGRKATISNTRLWDQTAPPADLYVDDPTLAAGTIKQIDWKTWGAKAAFDWKVVRNGEVLQRRTFYSNYRPWQSVFLRGI